VVNEADGYQPHIIAPENGYRWVRNHGRARARTHTHTLTHT
jgi:hypothetical protein